MESYQPTASRRGADERTRQIRRVLWLVLFANLAVALAKLAYGVLSGSLAVASDAVHSLLDASGNVVGLVAVRAAAAPPDERHPYGHLKVEIVAASLIGVLLALGGLRFGWDAVQTLMHGGRVVENTALGLGVMAVTFAVNAVVAVGEARRGRALASPILLADAAHTGSDLLVSAGVFLSLAGAHLGLTWADPAGALLVLVITVRVAWKILSSNLATLLDTAVVDAAQVVAIASAIQGVEGCHRVRSRGTPFAAHVDLHLLLDDEISLREAHGIAHRVEAALRAALPVISDITIHMEPAEDGEEDL
jgi:cation diffusion facilitator family transporter